MQLRVLNILTVRFAANGIAAFTMNYERFMATDAVCVDFVAPNEPSEQTRAEIESRGGRIFVLPQRNSNPVSYMRALGAIVRAGGYDVVHAHGNSATLYVDLAAAMRGGAHVRIAHSHNTRCKQRLADKLLRPLFYQSYTHALACSQAAGEWLFPNRPFTVVQNAVDTAAYTFSPQTRERVRGELALGDAPVICHVGSFNRQKNHAFLLAAFAKLLNRMPNARLLLVGSGALLAQTRQEAQSLGLTEQTLFLGNVESAAPYLMAADVFVLPSYYEGLPFTLIEAQCAGLPCCVSDRVVTDAFFTGCVQALSIDGPDAADGWAEALAAKLGSCSGVQQRLAASLEAVDAAGRNGFSIRQNAENLLGLYRQYVQEAREA